MTHRVWHPSVRATAKITNVLELLIVDISLFFVRPDSPESTLFTHGLFNVSHKSVCVMYTKSSASKHLGTSQRRHRLLDSQCNGLRRRAFANKGYSLFEEISTAPLSMKVHVESNARNGTTTHSTWAVCANWPAPLRSLDYMSRTSDVCAPTLAPPLHPTFRSRVHGFFQCLRLSRTSPGQ